MGKKTKQKKHAVKHEKQAKVQSVIKNGIKKGKFKASKPKLARIKSKLSSNPVEKHVEVNVDNIAKIQSNISKGKEEKKVKQKKGSKPKSNKKEKVKIKSESPKKQKSKVAMDEPVNATSNLSQNEENKTEEILQPTKGKTGHKSKPENTIFVGNLPPNTKKNQLKALFSPFGNVVSVRFRAADGKRIFKHEMRKKAESINGYVVFDNEKSKTKALSLSGTELKGRHIRVTPAKGFTDEVAPKLFVFVGNLRYNATDEKLYEIFSSCGELDYVRTIRNAKGCTGVAIVCFKKPESVGLALELNNTLLDDRPIRVQRYKANAKPKDNQKIITGPARRLAEKKKKTIGNKATNPAKAKMKSPKKEKKSDYQGKKISAVKKKSKNKKLTHLQQLAKKIAPK